MSSSFSPMWFVGVVVNNVDPLNSGRVKVRAFGIHPPPPEASGRGREQSSSTNPKPEPFVDDEDLPWAPVLQSGVGLGLPKPGDWVFGCFMDGRDAQHPMIMGIIPGGQLGKPSSTEGGDAYTPAHRDVVEHFGDAPMDPNITGEDISKTNAVNLQANWPERFNVGNRDGWQPADPQIAERDPDARVLRSKNGLNKVVVNNDKVVFQNEEAQVQMDSAGNVTIFTSAAAQIVGGNIQQGTEGNHDTNAKNRYTVTVTEGGVYFDVNGDFEVDCSNFQVNARDRAYINAGMALDLQGAQVHVSAITDNIDIWSKSKLRMYSGDISTWEVGSFEGMYITSKRVNWFNALDFKITSLVALDINTPGLLRVQGTKASFIGTALADFKSNGMANVGAPVVNVGTIAKLGLPHVPPIPITPLQVALPIGVPLGPLSEQFATVPNLPTLEGSNIKVGTTDVKSTGVSASGISASQVDDDE